MSLWLGILGASGLISGGDFEAISSVTVGSGGASYIEFTSIPSTFTDLQVRGLIRTNRTPTSSEALTVNFNTDSSSNYAFHILYGEGSGSGGAGGYASQTKAEIASMMAEGGASNIFGVFIADILDYSNTSKNTTIRSISGNDQNGSGVITLSSGLWNNTAAINAIKLDQPISTSFVEHTTAALYGIKA